MSVERRRRTSQVLLTGVVGIAIAATAAIVLRSPSAAPTAQETARAATGSALTDPGTGPLPSASVTAQSREVTEDLLMPPLQFSGLAGKASLTEPGASSAVALSQAPIPQALVAASDPADQRRVFVLADDLRWRRVDAPVRLCARSDKTSAPPLTPRAISPDATKLALPQPDRLVVIDVRSGSSRSYAAGGASNTHALWADRTHVLVTEDGALHGSLVDIVSGTVTPSPHGRTTAFTDRGLSLDWGPDPSVSAPETAMRWSDGTSVTTVLNNLGGVAEPPLVGDTFVVGHHRPLRDGSTLQAGPTPDNGLVFVDRRSGNPLLYQPTVRLPSDATTLLALSGNTVVFSSQRVPTEDLLVLALDPHGRSTGTFARFPPGTAFAWGRGWPAGG